ncbi:MAG: nucleotidyltransferase family protein [Stellaceae bacterium]
MPANASAQAQALRFEQLIRADRDLMGLLAAIRALQLPQWPLVAGCLYQTVWNVLTSRPPRTGIKDYDLIYFDDRDLSWAAEDAVIRRVEAATQGRLGPIETRNQARVHLWFESRFGVPYPKLPSANAIRNTAPWRPSPPGKPWAVSGRMSLPPSLSRSSQGSAGRVAPA